MGVDNVWTINGLLVEETGYSDMQSAWRVPPRQLEQTINALNQSLEDTTYAMGCIPHDASSLGTSTIPQENLEILVHWSHLFTQQAWITCTNGYRSQVIKVNRGNHRIVESQGGRGYVTEYVHIQTWPFFQMNGKPCQVSLERKSRCA